MRKPADSEIDSPEMIQRCLNCELSVCRGMASCASGKKQLEARTSRKPYDQQIAELILAGKKRSDIRRELNLRSCNIAQYITYAIQKGLLTQEQADASRDYARRKRGEPNGVHSKKAPADR